MIVRSESFADLSLSNGTRVYVDDYGEFQWLRFVRGGSEIWVRWDELNEAVGALMEANVR